MQPCATKSSVKHTDRNNIETILPCDDEYKAIRIEQNEEIRNYLDLYTVGTLWVGALSTALVGEKVSIVPVVNAVIPEGAPQKPSPMKYQDLPIYESPHRIYKENQLKKCPDANVRLIHRFLYPHVKFCREKICTALCNVRCTVMENYNSVKHSVKEKKETFKQTMRDPENLGMRCGVVAAGGLTGYIIGARSRRRLLMTSLGLLAAGALTFPKETDEIFRSVVFYTRKTFLDLYNAVTGYDMKFREKGACKDELPPPPGTRADMTKICPKNK